MKKIMILAIVLMVCVLTACGNPTHADTPSPGVAPDPSVTQSADPSPSADLPDPSPSVSADLDAVVSDPVQAETQGPSSGGGEEGDPSDAKPENTPAPEVTTTPKPQETVKPTAAPAATPNPSATVKPVATPTPAPAVTATPNPTATPVATLKPTATPQPTATPVATATPAVTPTPTPTPVVEVIDTAALEEYARQYAEETYGYDGNPNTGFDSNAGYFPPSTWTIPTMEEGYRIAREGIDTQYAHDTGVGHPITYVLDGVTYHRMINMYFEPTDDPNVFLVYCFYGGERV